MRRSDGAALNPVYWGRNLREPVRFRQAIETLLANGLRSFLELAPHPLLAAQVRQMGPDATVVSPLRRGRADAATLRAALIPLAVDTRPERDGRRPRHLLLLSPPARPRRWRRCGCAGRRGCRRTGPICVTPPWSAGSVSPGASRCMPPMARMPVAACWMVHSTRGHAVPGALPPFDQIRGTDESWSDHLDRCAAAFVAGAEIDGTLFDADEPWRVVSAPTYPFERERHWLPVADAGLSYAVGWEPFVPRAASADQTEEARAAWPDVPVVALMRARSRSGRGGDRFRACRIGHGSSGRATLPGTGRAFRRMVLAAAGNRGGRSDRCPSAPRRTSAARAARRRSRSAGGAVPGR